jgi:hypothetical protein
MRDIHPDFLKPEALQRYIPIMYSMSKHVKDTSQPNSHPQHLNSK